MMEDRMSELEAATQSSRHLALLRISLLEDGGDGLAVLMISILEEALDSFLPLLVADSADDNNCSYELVVKKSKILGRVLSLYLSMIRLDLTQVEEFGRQGSHTCLRRLIDVDVNRLPSEETQDLVFELHDMACEIVSQGTFQKNALPYTREEQIQRLPLKFHFHTDDAILIHQVTARQSAQEDVGFVMWPSAVALSHWLMSNSNLIKNQTVLELGAGCGLTGLVAARLQAREVILTDFNQTVLRNLLRNVRLNDVVGCRVLGLDFYEQSGDSHQWKDLSGSQHRPVDVVVAADVICQADDAYAVANTVHDCLKVGGRAVVVCANANHRFGVDHFRTACDRVGLNVTENRMALEDGLSEDLLKASGYVPGMGMDLFQIRKVRQ